MANPVNEVATKEEVLALRKTVDALRHRVLALEDERREVLLVVRQVSRKEAKQEVLSYIQRHPGSYPSDAALALSLDPALVRDLAAELVKDGLLEG